MRPFLRKKTGQQFGLHFFDSMILRGVKMRTVVRSLSLGTSDSGVYGLWQTMALFYTFQTMKLKVPTDLKYTLMKDNSKGNKNLKGNGVWQLQPATV